MQTEETKGHKIMSGVISYLKILASIVFVFFVFAFALSLGNQFGLNMNKTGLSRAVIENGVSRETAEIAKTVAEGNKLQAESESISSSTIISFAQGLVATIFGIALVVFVIFLLAVAMSVIARGAS